MDHKIISARSDDLEFVLNLNQINTPAVSDSSFEMMSYFLKVSEYFKILNVGEKPIGFLIALMPGKDYKSENYRWFNSKYNSFMYIDRVVISGKYQRRGFGSELLYKVECEAKRDGLSSLSTEASLISYYVTDRHAGEVNFTAGFDRRNPLRYCLDYL